MKTDKYRKFRFADLQPGDKFTREGSSEILTVSNEWGLAWLGNQKIRFGDNALVVPEDKPTVARRKYNTLRRTAKRFGLTYSELVTGYREIVILTSPSPYRDRLPLTDNCPLYECLETIGLIFWHNGKRLVAGYANEFLI